MIRPVSIEDASELSGLFASYVRATSVTFETVPPGPEEMGARIAATTPSYPWLVAEESGQIVAYAYASSHRPKPAYRWSADVSVYVREGFGGRGLGTALYAALLPRVAALGYANVFAGIALPNAASVALHERFGFRAVGVYQRVGYKLGAWHDVGWWQKAFTYAQPPQEPTKPL